MARRQGPEEKYYPQVWRFLWRCILPFRLHGKEIPLHQEMVSVTGSVTWISHGSSVIGISLDPKRQWDERHDSATGRKEPPEAMRPTARRRKTNATPPPVHGSQGTDPTIHRQVRKEDRPRRKQERMRWIIASGVSSPRTDFQPSWTIFGLKKKRCPGFRTGEAAY